MTIELTDVDARAFVYWLKELEAKGTVEMYEYQLETLVKLGKAVGVKND